MDPSSEVVHDLLPILRVYKDGRVERYLASELVPPSPLGDPKTSVSSKDITISLNPDIQARIYIPNQILSNPTSKKLPLLLYFHGGAFLFESAMSLYNQRYLNHIVSRSNVVAVSVNYQKAPEHPLPSAYEDSWSALQWVFDHKTANGTSEGGGAQLEPWLVNHVDFDRIFVGGDSAGANIAHNMAMRVGAEKLPKLQGVFMGHVYFWGSDTIGSESVMDPNELALVKRVWMFANPTTVNGIDDPRINPIGPGEPSLSVLACNRVFVFVAGKDSLVERGKAYVDALKKNGWEGEVELFENEEEGHALHIYDPESVNAQLVLDHLASFLNSSVDVTLDIAQDLLRAADQYLLEGLKRLCEYAIGQDISLENVSSMYELSESFHATSLRNTCILFILEHFEKLGDRPGDSASLQPMDVISDNT